MKLDCEKMKGNDALDYGKVRMASNKPEWCCLIVVGCDDGEISILWDEKHDYLDVSKMKYEVKEDEDPNEHIDVDDAKRKEILDWIASYCE